MDVYRTEEEQIEAIKTWWKDNGSSAVMGVVVVLGLWFGWNFWQDQSRTTAEGASEIYQNMVEAVENIALASDDKKESQIATAKHLAGQLKDEYNSTTYAKFAALFMAKQAVEDKELDKAVTELNWVIDSKPDEELVLVTKLRLARVLFAQGKSEESLALIEGVQAGSLQAQYDEVKGDIYLSLGREDEARSAYSSASALAKTAGQNPGRGAGSVAEMKANDLTKPSAVVAAPSQAGE